MVIAACTPDQCAWETDAHGSVLTHFLLEAWRQDASDLNGDGSLTVQEAYRFIEQDIADYVHSSLHEEQQPMLFDDATDGIVLKQR